MSLLERVKKISTVKESAILATSKFFNKKDMVQTPVPMLNVALSGSLSGGLAPGLTLLAGASKNFKTGFLLTMVKAYMDKYPDSVCVYYDSEFGTPQSYFSSFGIDMDRVLHVPITDLEMFKFDVMAYFDAKNPDALKRGDKVIFAVDSIGNLASIKEVTDAVEGKSSQDMTRAKVIKGIFRMVTPHLNLKDIPMVTINHTYKTQELYAKDVVSGGTGQYYSADNIFIISRQQEKTDDGIAGYNFVLNIEKSRFVKEKSKIAIEVRYESGMSKWSGLLALAVESGHVAECKIGRSKGYQKVDKETGEVLEQKYKYSETQSKDFWLPVLTDKTFSDFIETKYRVAQVKMLSDDEIAKEFEALEEDEEEEVA